MEETRYRMLGQDLVCAVEDMNLDPVRDDEKISNPGFKQEGGEGEADEADEKTAPSEASTSSTPGNPIILPLLPFELKPSPGKGTGAFALHGIKCGSGILIEDPLIQGTNHPLFNEAIFATLYPYTQYQITSLHNNPCSCPSSAFTPCSETPLMKIRDANSFQSESDATRKPHASTHLRAASITHVSATLGGDLWEELTISYYPRKTTAEERREHLKYVYGFECGCQHCRNRKSVTRSDVDRMYIDHDKIDISRPHSDRVEQQRTVLFMVENWYSGLVKERFPLREEFRVLLTEKRLFSLTLGDSWVREQLVKDFLEKMGSLLRENNGCGIEEEVLDKYLRGMSLFTGKWQMRWRVSHFVPGKAGKGGCR